jgi:hypothetical protein
VLQRSTSRLASPEMSSPKGGMERSAMRASVFLR